MSQVWVVGKEFCHEYPVRVILMKRKGLNAADFVVKDSNGNRLLQVNVNKMPSLRLWRLLTSPSGTPLLTMRTKIMSLHESWEAFKGDSTMPGKLLFTAGKAHIFEGLPIVNSVSSSPSSHELNVYLPSSANDNKNKKPDFKIFCNSSSWCSIYKGKRLLAESVQAARTEQNSNGRVVTIYANVDYVFIISLLVVHDELFFSRTQVSI